VPCSGRSSRDLRVHAEKEASTGINIRALSDIITSQPLDDEQRTSLERIAGILDVPIGQVKNMAFKRRGLLSLTNEEIHSKIKKVAEVVEVPEQTAREMVAIQPGLLFDTDKQCETLKFGIQAICYELNASKEEVVELIMKNQSVLHGRELRLSVADLAHLAMLREPKGRIVD